MNHSVRSLDRRSFLRYAASASVLALIAGSARPSVAASAAEIGAAGLVTIEKFDSSGKSLGLFQVAKVVKSDAEWRAQLGDGLAYQVTRHEATERPFSGEYDKPEYAGGKADGLYRCICCDTALYDSRTKYDSHTGWPSFWQPISPHNITRAEDRSLGVVRTKISCARCDAHLGHVFEDGPQPTGLRYCMDSVALHFVARSPAAG